MIPFGRDGGSKKVKKDITKRYSETFLKRLTCSFSTISNFYTNTRNSNLPHWTTIKVDPAVSRGAAKPVGAN